jgi:hypothetical protein
MAGPFYVSINISHVYFGYSIWRKEAPVTLKHNDIMPKGVGTDWMTLKKVPVPIHKSQIIFSSEVPSMTDNI